MKNKILITIAFTLATAICDAVFALPSGFVYLRDKAPSVIQDIRYAGYHNFVGRPIASYQSAECILTEAAAQHLANAQTMFFKLGYSLKVYDCYRPTDAVDDFIAWGKDPTQQTMKAEFYPTIMNKEDLFPEYIANQSGHSRGSTVDLTVVPLPLHTEPAYHSNDPLVACTAPYHTRYEDNSIDMGTGYDCMDPRANSLNPTVSQTAHQNRMWLRTVMIQAGFVPYEAEWWHFTLKDEPYPSTYFNFPVAR